jgi:hypothetical protein
VSSRSNPNSSERILINLATYGCQAYPIDSNPSATPTPSLTPTAAGGPTPTNPPTPTPPPASVFSNATFTYDGDGNLVKKIKPDGSKTLYVGGIYEVDKTSGGTVTGTKTYYPAAGAMRIGSTLYYVLKDHLGSASVVTDASGNTISGGEARYYPFGEARFSTSSIPTDRLFTG